MRRIWTLVLMVTAGVAAGCEDGTGLGGDGARVTVAFESRAGSAGVGAAMLGLRTGGLSSAIAVPGSNGVLTLDMVHAILAEFELKRVEDDCDDGDDSDDDGSDDCEHSEEFETGPELLDLPLEGSTTAVSGDVPVGAFDELEFEIEDLDDDEEDPAEAERIRELFESIREQFPDWPRDASMRVVGTFTPEGGEPRAFVVYLEAEVEVELEFDTPFVVTEDDVSRTITVELDPRGWFVREDGSVVDLSRFDFGTTGLVPEFEVEIENGFERVEHDDD